ncbi:MBL fold metallo-hydrolase [Candidatus Uabimicrobium amorphum]|uniref:Cyclase n=1 Tax=Uabimicrobium amorphum TaxID=2596890 RepID=A0A5S9IJ53_UABAM|nr:MBL fold metallo-hydrolase [Candidatus Uabimicrobium amorphum]BBM82342.1 cyclase [Candidatus Uabimicrobium amorphum]
MQKYIVLVFFVLSSMLVAQKAQINTHDVGDNIHMLTGPGGNIAVSIGKDGVFIIDDLYARHYKEVTAAITKLTDQKVRFVINTHWHADHSEGNELFVVNHNSTVLAHDNVRKTMAEPQMIKYFKSLRPASPEKALPVITYSKTMTLHFNGQDVVLIHVPNAHTDGDSIVFFQQANVIHMGDTFFKGRYPFIDQDHGGSIRGIIEAANKVLQIATDKTKIIPGHGSISSTKELTDYRNMLMEVEKRVQKLVDDKLTLKEIIAKDPLKDLNPVWGQGFMKSELFLTILFDDLSEK